MLGNTLKLPPGIPQPVPSPPCSRHTENGEVVAETPKSTLWGDGLTPTVFCQPAVGPEWPTSGQGKVQKRRLLETQTFRATPFNSIVHNPSVNDMFVELCSVPTKGGRWWCRARLIAIAMAWAALEGPHRTLVRLAGHRHGHAHPQPLHLMEKSQPAIEVRGGVFIGTMRL